MLPDLLDRTPEAEAARRTVQRLGKELVALRDDIPEEAAQILERFDDPARLADVIAYNGTMPIAEKIELLAQQDVLARLRTLMRYLMREIRIAQVSKSFAERAAGEIGETSAASSCASSCARSARSSARTTSRAPRATS